MAENPSKENEILHLEKFETDIPPPSISIDSTCLALKTKGVNSYIPLMGKDELRIASTHRVARTSGHEYDWQSECIITAGGMTGILNCLLTLLKSGDEVIITDPTYAGYMSRIRIAKGIPVFVPLIPSLNGWRLDIQAFERAISSRTRILLLSSPGMPSGNVFNHSEWEFISKICCQKNLYLIYDAQMERILYDQRSVIHPLSFPGMLERTITVGSASFELRMLGWRTGWIIGPRGLMKEIGSTCIANAICQPGISVAGVTAALNASDDGLQDVVAIWQERRDILLRELDGLPIISPHGGWSILLDAEGLRMSSEEIVKKLLKEANIAVSSMTGWGENGAKYVRFVFSNEPKERLLGVGKKVKIALGIS